MLSDCSQQQGRRREGINEKDEEEIRPGAVHFYPNGRRNDAKDYVSLYPLTVMEDQGLSQEQQQQYNGERNVIAKDDIAAAVAKEVKEIPYAVAIKTLNIIYFKYVFMLVQ